MVKYVMIDLFAPLYTQKQVESSLLQLQLITVCKTYREYH